MYELTIFKSPFDNKTDKTMQFNTWDEFTNLLEMLSKTPMSGKENSQLISPAVYEEGTTRSNANVKYWGGWAAVDVDEFDGDVEKLASAIKHRFVIYSTPSSTVNQPKFRIVFDLDRNAEADEIKAFWFALQKYLGELGDEQTKDLSRMYYIPGMYLGSNHFFYRGEGDPVSIGKLKILYPYVEKTGNSFLDRMSPEMREQVLEYRKSQLTNTDYSWSGYRDCPFFPNKMAEKYKTVSETGWYSQMYRIMIAVACNAVKSKYPITQEQIAQMCQELDQETGNWYENRPLSREAGGALEWAYANTFEE
jgi:hypothetical protein